MKNINSIKSITLLIFMALSTTVMFNACKDDDPCDGVVCQNGGTCNDGNCECAVGYEGANCETAMADKFVATWKYNENCPGFPPVADYTVIVSKTAPNKIQFNGFAGFACGVNNILVSATVNGRDITVDANQSFCSGDVVITSGSGSINAAGDVMNISYAFTIQGSSGSCSGVYNK